MNIKGTWRHKDGGIYEILGLSEYTNSANEVITLVEYRPVNGSSEIYVRTKKHFLSSFKLKD